MSMEEDHKLLVSLTHIIFSVSLLLLYSNIVAGEGLPNGQKCGYVKVRTDCYLFWWYFQSPHRVGDPTQWPIVLWHEGGPGISSTGVGNYQKIGPESVNHDLSFLNARQYDWLQKADLLFVDSPVGTGFSYVKGNKLKLLASNDEEAARDLFVLVKDLFEKESHKRRLYIFGEEYGGKLAVLLGLKILDAIQNDNLMLQLGGVGLGNSWISPVDSVLTWAPLLKDMSRLDTNDFKRLQGLAQKIMHQTSIKDYGNATLTWFQLKNEIYILSNYVDLYDFTRDSENKPRRKEILMIKDDNTTKFHSKTRDGYTSDEFAGFMNGYVAGMIRSSTIIPDTVTWKLHDDMVFHQMAGDYMKPVIEQVAKLLSQGVSVTIYNGQLDVVCSTKGAQAWVKQLTEWTGLQSFLNTNWDIIRFADGKTVGFEKSHANLMFYWILNAGHSVPTYQQMVSLDILEKATQSAYVR